MTLISQGAPYIASQQETGWTMDSDQQDIVPIHRTGTLALDGLARGIGHGLTGRALFNDLCPTGLAMVQPAIAGTAASFTTRRAINGTLVNCNNLGTYAAAEGGVFPPSSISLVGRTLRIRASGFLGCTGTPNLTVDVGLGSGVLATTGALALAAITGNQPWVMDVHATVQTAGASGVTISEGFFLYSSSSSVVVLPWTMGNSTRGTGLSKSLTVANAVTLNATLSASDPANLICCCTMSVEVLY